MTTTVELHAAYSGELQEGKPNLSGRTKEGFTKDWPFTYRLTLELTFKESREVWMGG